MTIRLPIVTALLLSATVARSMADDQPVKNVSIVQLIVSPEKYNGKHVSFKGYATVGFESNYIYLHRDDATHYIFENSIPFEVPYALRQNKALYNQYLANNNRYVLIQATFIATYDKTTGNWSYRVKDITRFVPWGPPDPSSADKSSDK